MGQLNDKVVLITGATSGIWRRTAELFVKEGAYVVLSGRRKTEGKALETSLGNRVLYVEANVSEDEQVGNLMQNSMNE